MTIPKVGQFVLFKIDNEFGKILQIVEVTPANRESYKTLIGFRAELGVHIKILWDEKIGKYHDLDFISWHLFVDNYFITFDTEQEKLFHTLKL